MKGFISEHGQLSGGYTTEENSMTLWNIHDVSFQCLPLFIVYVSLSIKYSSSFTTQGQDTHGILDSGTVASLVASLLLNLPFTETEASL